ncbi:MAG TPA: threonylcarbamoyl-AMP synthase [Gammaproteobacteria bacterium]|jgi:L-threonylcarbamoyladenylate synthase|nr:threonylcarbamoyl-AMP synthase [Gammaproteobacteria bacterium]
MPTITRDITVAAARLRAGGLVGLPTETVYGLAARADNPEAVASLFALKGRPASNPLIVHLSDVAQVEAWAVDPPPGARRLMDAFWPGPLTLVLDAQPSVSRQITAGQDTVALRIPDHPLARDIIRAAGGALVAPSANRYTALSPTLPAHVAAQFADSDLLIVDGGPCRVGIESTIVGLVQGADAMLLRPGMLSAEVIAEILGAPLAAPGASAPRTPGQHRRHYAPRTPAHLFENMPPHDPNSARIGWIFCGEDHSTRGPAFDLGRDPAGYAARLYATLHALDGAELDAICIARPPASSAWRAVHDRLARATVPAYPDARE